MAGGSDSTPASGQLADGERPDAAGGPVPRLALYRRYRPATFAEVKGQEHVTEPLQQALRSGRVHHAYLFSGPRGCGKTSSARILARSLNCEQGPTPDPCGKCASCVALAPSGPGSIDVIEIDAASHGGVDDARDLRERAFYSPVSARYKIYIIDEAHMVTGGGFNALLKLVEEPPPHLKFVFATTEPEKVIPTIRSRTHHYPFRLVPPAVLRELLEGILRAEGVSYEPAVLPVVIRAAAGSARDSLSILDQLIAGTGGEGLRYERAIMLLGYTDDALLDETAEALIARDGAAAFRAIDRVIEAGHDPRRFAADLLDRLRDLIILGAVPGAAAAGLLDAPEDRLEQMRKQAAAFGADRLVRAAEVISTGLVEMRGTTSPRLLLELMTAQLLLPPDDAKAAGLTDRLDRLEARLAGQSAAGEAAAPGPGAARPGGPRTAAGAPAGAPTTGPLTAGQDSPGPAPGPAAAARDVPAASRPAAPAPPGSARPSARPPVRPAAAAAVRDAARPEAVSGPAATASPGAGPAVPAQATAGAREPAAAAPRTPGRAPGIPDSAAAAPGTPGRASGIPDAAALRARWPDVLDAVRKVRKVAWLLLSNASVESLQDNVLTLAFPREGDAKGFAGSGCDAELGDVLAALFGAAPTIRSIAQPVVQGSGAASRPEPGRAAAPADRGRQGAPGPGAGRAGQHLADDPRLLTDSDEDAGPRGLTGPDLIQQELGGRVISEDAGQ